MKKLIYLIAVLLVCGSALQAQEEYWRVVSAEQVKTMNAFERAQYLKGLNALNAKQYRSAALEFERFTLQFQSSDMKPYMIFLRAYSLYCAKDRNKAISVFNEVVDYFPGEINAAAPAIYYRGMAHFDNGDYAKGMTSMKEVIDDADYQEHRVAASASLQLVRNYWRNKEPEKAAAYLKQIFDNFRKKAPSTADSARDLYVAYCMATGRHKEYQAWYFETFAADAVEKKLNREQFRINMAELPYRLVVHYYHSLFNHDDRINKYRGYKKKGGTDPYEQVWQVLKDLRSSYEKEGKLWDWFEHVIRLNVYRRFMKPAELEDIVAQCCKHVATLSIEKDVNRRVNCYNHIVSLLIQARRFDQATYVNNRIDNLKTRGWNEYEILRHQNKWQESIAQLDRIRANFKDDANLVRRANWARGWIYRDQLRKYDDAIAAYREVADPPRNLWDIAECHKRKNDKNAAIRQYIEIENAFPNDGPAAAWARADYYHHLGDKTMAVKEGRYIMKKYPKSRQSSYAHQLLEKYGIETGGGVVDDM